jgi:hypothetical protein
MNVIEQRQEHELALQREKTIEPERPQLQKGLDYPRMR